MAGNLGVSSHVETPYVKRETKFRYFLGKLYTECLGPGKEDGRGNEGGERWDEQYAR
jgi:hypothetical protein